MLFAYLLLLPQILSAQTDYSSFKDLKISGYIDGSYNYLLNSRSFTSGTNDRVFDLAYNGVTLQQASVTAAYQPIQGFGALANVIIGRDTYTFSPYGWNPDHGSQWFGLGMPQAYAQYIDGKFTLLGGIFLTLVGAESLIPTLDTNFSRSILDGYAEPSTTLGVRGIYAKNHDVIWYLGMYNGWDSIRDVGSTYTINLGAGFTVVPELTLSVQALGGEQRATDKTDFGPKGNRYLVNIIATYKATKELAVILSYDYAFQTIAALPNGDLARAKWQGMSLYFNYQFNKCWRTSVRGEYFDDPNGYRTGVQQNWREATITIGYKPIQYIKNLEFRAETRRDFTNVACIPRIRGEAGTLTKNQQSFALEVVYSAQFL